MRAWVVAQPGPIDCGPLRLVEPDEGWPYTWAAYRCLYGVD